MPSSAEPLSFGEIALRLLVVLLLVLANGFFVAAEFALVSARRSKIDQLAARGDRAARAVQHILDNVYRYISATQLGITLASLALGYLGEEALAVLFDRALVAVGLALPSAAAHTAAAITTAFILLTFSHIVLGELTPKAMALANPEGVSRWIARPLQWFSLAATPFAWLLFGSARAFMRLLGLPMLDEHTRVHSPEELRLLVLQTHKHGLLDPSDTAMLAGVFDFHNKRARDVMRPRTEVVGIPIDASEEEVWRILRSERYSRYPVYEGTLDDVVGVFLAKDLWLYEGAEPFSLRRFVREARYVPDTSPAERVFHELRTTRAHMAIVLDEYGGTAGIITIEDLVEEIVGDIADEYDVMAREAMEVGGVLELAGSMSLVDARSDYHLAIPEGSWTTIGGYVFSTLGRLPKVGDRVPYPGGELEVVAMDGRRVAAVRVHRAPPPATAA